MANITISTCIDDKNYQKIKTNMWKVPDLLREGIKSREGNKEIVERLRLMAIERNELKELNNVMQSKLQLLATRCYNLEFGAKNVTQPRS